MAALVASVFSTAVQTEAGLAFDCGSSSYQAMTGPTRIDHYIWNTGTPISGAFGYGVADIYNWNTGTSSWDYITSAYADAGGEFFYSINISYTYVRVNLFNGDGTNVTGGTIYACSGAGLQRFKNASCTALCP